LAPPIEPAGRRRYTVGPFPAAIAMPMQGQDANAVAYRLAELRVEHRDLDVAIAHLAAAGCDELQLTRMKKRKLLLKDTIARLESQLIPDLDA
jgi:hypothetical protein